MKDFKTVLMTFYQNNVFSSRWNYVDLLGLVMFLPGLFMRLNKDWGESNLSVIFFSLNDCIWELQINKL